MDSRLIAHLRTRHFSLVVALAELGSTHRAAERLNMTQSTVSKMLADLETLLDARLFERGPRGLAVTPLGGFVLSEARAQLARIERFGEEMHLRKMGDIGTLSLGTIIGAAPHLVGHAVADIKAEYPGLRVRIEGETSDQILNLLREATIDLAIGRFSSPAHHELFDFEPLAGEPLVFVVRHDHPLTELAPRDLGDLTGWPWVLQPETTPTRRLIDDSFASQRIAQPTNVVESRSLLTILHLIRVSDSIALLPASIVEAHLEAKFIATLPIRPHIRVGDIGIVTRKAEPRSAVADAFLTHLRKRSRQAGPLGGGAV